MKPIHHKIKRWAAGSALLLAAVAANAGVTFSATDLADATPGEDLWQIDYTISGPLANFDSINLYFALGSYKSLSASAADFFVDPPVQPDPTLGLDGFASFTALGDKGAGFTGKATVTFVWLDSGTPGGQPYELIDRDFNLKDSGFTSPTPAVPEPSAALLLLAGLGALGAAARKRAG